MQIQNETQPVDISHLTDAKANAPSALPTSIDGLANENTFLQLLVAQIKNQDPLSPTDGVQFLSQLAQFTQVEQSTQMRDELKSIHDLLSQLASSHPRHHQIGEQEMDPLAPTGEHRQRVGRAPGHQHRIAERLQHFAGE